MEFQPTALNKLLVSESGTSDFSRIKFEPYEDGGTKAGIKQATYDSWRLAHGQEPQSVEFISEQEMVDIYWNWYWLVDKCPQLPDGIDYAVFQAGVNTGVGTAAKLLQGVVGVTIDGRIGPVTLRAVADYVAANGSDALAIAFLDAQKTRYAALIQADSVAVPSRNLAADWDGWISRINDTYAFIAGSLTTAAQAIASAAAAAAEEVANNPGTSAALALLVGGGVFFC